MRHEKGIKAFTGAFAAAILLLSLQLSSYAAEDPYILLLPISSEIAYDLDADHISEEYSADKYTILLYEAGETVEFRVTTDYVYSIEDVSDGTAFEDYSVVDGLVSFDMPKKDLCFVLGEELREDTEDLIEEEIVDEELASESVERVQEYTSGIEIILDGYSSAEVSMVDGAEESVSGQESFHTEKAVDLFKVYSSNGFSVSPKISVWKNGVLQEDVSGIIISKGSYENYYTIDLANELDLSNSYTIEVINPEGQEKLIPESAYQAGDAKDSISLALIGDMSAKVLMVDGSTVSLEQDEDFKTEDKIDLLDISFGSGSYTESPDVYIYRNGELLEDVSDIVMSRGDYQGSYRVDLVNSMNLDAVYEIFIVDADASYEELVTDELAEAEEAAEAEEIARANEAIEEEEAAEAEIAEAEEREAEEVAEEESIKAEEAVGEEAREEQEAAVETLEEEEAAEEEIIEEEEAVKEEAEEEEEAAEAEIADMAGTTVVPTDSGDTVERGGDFSFRIQIEEGYTKTDEFAVKANGVELEENADGSFTIHDVTDDQTITVEGVKDVTAPELEIFIDDESFTKQAEEESYIFSDPVTVRIEASDEGSGLKSLEYVLSSESFTETEEIGEWTEYTEELTVEGSEDQYLYTRAVDRDGNVSEFTTAFSFGIVRPAPALFGVAETVAGKADGKISGLDDTMEYSTDGSDYTSVTDPDMEFAAGTYYLRYAADENDPASEAAEISIGEGRKLLVVFIADSDIVDVIEVDYGGTISENKLPEIPEKEGYERSDASWDAESFDDIKEDMIVRAMYQKNEFTVSFSNALAGYGYTVDRDSEEEEAAGESETTEAETERAVSREDVENEEDFEFSLILFGELLADVEKTDGSMESAEPDSTLTVNDSIEKIVVYANTSKKPEILLSKNGAEIGEEDGVYEVTEEENNSYLIEFEKGAVTDGSWVLIISE